MEGEKTKFLVLNEIFSQLTEENRDSLLKTAQTRLGDQEDGAEMIADASVLIAEAGRAEMA